MAAWGGCGYLAAPKSSLRAVSVAELDAVPETRLKGMLADCCGSSRWVETMVERRPFRSRHLLLATADEVWRSLEHRDWLEAFAHHPRIGERTIDIAQGEGEGERGSAWSVGEQAGVEAAGDDMRDALAQANLEYERRFGYIHIVCATGKTAFDILQRIRARLGNDPDAEIEVAAEEQRMITRLRIEKLLDG